MRFFVILAFLGMVFPFSLRAENKPAGISPIIDIAPPLSQADIAAISPATAPASSFDAAGYDAQFGYQVPNGPLRFDLMLSEFQRLRQAAKMAGGDVEITVKPIGFKMADYIVPLQRVGFEVQVASDGGVVVSSSPAMENLELRRAGLQKEVNELKETRRRLLSDIKSLQSCMNPAYISSDFADNKNTALEIPIK